MAERVAHLLVGGHHALRAQDLRDLARIGRVQLGGRTGWSKGGDLEDHVALDEVRQLRTRHGGRDDREETLDPTAGVGRERVALVELLAEADEAGERPLERNLVRHRDGTEVVEHGLDGRRRPEAPDGDWRPLLGHAQRMWAVVEVLGRPMLVTDRGPLRQGGDPTL